ncbi:MAG: hypothetical protein L3J59_04765 [Methylococcaceae bacterium]|nr:hypothetical protein [Methylococcaceae bacterium]
MKYKLLAIFILTLSIFNLSVAGEKRKSNYFGDDNFYAGEIKKKSKNNINQQPKRLESEKKQSKRSRRVKLKTDRH